jgi:hypothetical protein
VIKRSLQHGKADPDAAGRHGECGRECGRVDIGTVAVEMVLNEEDGIHALLLGQPGFLDRFVNDPSVRRGVS